VGPLGVKEDEIHLYGQENSVARHYCFTTFLQSHWSTQAERPFKRKAVTHMVQLRQVLHESPLHTVAPIEHLWHQCPPSVQDVLLKYSAVFQDTDGLPPTQNWDHTIPLIPGAQPVTTRAYRFPPDQKNEIEKQKNE